MQKIWLIVGCLIFSSEAVAMLRPVGRRQLSRFVVFQQRFAHKNIQHAAKYAKLRKKANFYTRYGQLLKALDERNNHIVAKAFDAHARKLLKDVQYLNYQAIKELYDYLNMKFSPNAVFTATDNAEFAGKELHELLVSEKSPEEKLLQAKPLQEAVRENLRNLRQRLYEHGMPDTMTSEVSNPPSKIKGADVWCGQEQSLKTRYTECVVEMCAKAGTNCSVIRNAALRGKWHTAPKAKYLENLSQLMKNLEEDIKKID